MSKSTTTVAGVPSAVVPPMLMTATEYAALDKSGKARARKSVDDRMRSAIRRGDLSFAQECSEWLDNMKSATKRTAEPVDYRQLVADRIATLRHAADLLESRLVRPDTMPEAVDLSDLPEGAIDTESARTIARTKISRRTTREVIQGVVDDAFADLPNGAFLTFAQVGVMGGHPRGSGASGAIAARVDWDDMTTTLDGVIPSERTATQPRGLIKDDPFADEESADDDGDE